MKNKNETSSWKVQVMCIKLEDYDCEGNTRKANSNMTKFGELPQTLIQIKVYGYIKTNGLGQYPNTKSTIENRPTEGLKIPL